MQKQKSMDIIRFFFLINLFNIPISLFSQSYSEYRLNKELTTVVQEFIENTGSNNREDSTYMLIIIFHKEPNSNNGILKLVKTNIQMLSTLLVSRESCLDTLIGFSKWENFNIAIFGNYYPKIYIKKNKNSNIDNSKSFLKIYMKFANKTYKDIQIGEDSSPIRWQGTIVYKYDIDCKKIQFISDHLPYNVPILE